MKKQPLHFLGPKSENRPFYVELINLIFNDYVFWRRNFHPNDPTALTYKETQNQENQEYQEEFINELYKLLAELKLDPPFFSPRYMAHMISETTMASQLAYIATLLYNPNNVSSEASPITLKFELEVGKQFANLFGYNPKEAFGHITSGGTMANYQSLYYNFNLRFLPLCLGIFAKENQKDIGYSLNEFLNIPYEEYENFLEQHKELLNSDFLENYMVSNLGIRNLEKLVLKHFNQELPEIKILTSSTAHYSWKRGASLLGLGTKNIIKVPLNDKFEIDTEALEDCIKETIKKNQIIIQASFVFGSTEFGSFDPLDKIVSIRNKFKKSLYFPIHIDAAYGGYFCTLDKSQLSAQSFQEKRSAIAQTESVTVDPHKLGFCPYGAGAFVFKFGKLKKYLSAEAHYCFDPQTNDDPSDIQLGKYILEGSKPGASAASVYFNHKMIPLNAEGFGVLLNNLCSQANTFSNKLSNFQHNKYQLTPVNSVQSNIICFFVKLNKEGGLLSRINERTSDLAAHFGIKKIKSIQEYDFIVSNTKFYLKDFKEKPSFLEGIEIDADYFQVVRVVFMNQYHHKPTLDHKDYMDEFLDNVDNYLTTLPTKS